MSEQESMHDPRRDPEEILQEPRKVPTSPAPEHPGIPPAIQELQMELAKTGVISDTFKDYIMRMVLVAADEVVGSMSPGGVEQEALRKEFISRRFDDKACVKLSARSIEELSEQCFERTDSGKLIGIFLDRRFPDPHDVVKKLLLGTYDEVVSVREWLWREINEDPESFCDIEKEVLGD